MDIETIQENVAALVAGWAPQRSERMARRALDPADFAALGKAGMTLTGVPVEFGGVWQDPARSIRSIAALHRTIARIDPSLALVTTMHPTVLTAWSMPPPAAPRDPAAWDEQRARVLGHARDGFWFGTISSEPGSGGDLAATRTTARPGTAPDSKPDSNRGWLMTGDKHMGSGSGATAFMVSHAVPAGASEPDVFLLDMRGHALDGATGVRLVREWDGHGMMATQSHAFRFDDFPAERHALRAGTLQQGARFMPVSSFLFAGVIMGVLDAAQAEAKARLQPKAERMGAYERVAWTEAANRIWLADQAYEGMARAIEASTPLPAVQHGKIAIAELAEAAMQALSRAIGGSSFSRSNPFGQWSQDVRALGFLRPPWGLAHDRLFHATLDG